MIFNINALQATLIQASSFGWNATDATAAFQNAINANYDTIIIDMQPSDWITQPNKFMALSNKTIIFQNGVNLVAKSGAFGQNSNRLLEFINCSNINVIGYGASFIMKKAEYSTGEWRHCLAIENCNHMNIVGLKLANSGGDGVYVDGTGLTSNYSEYIYLKDIWCDNNKRNGISIVSAQHFLAEHCWFTNTNGTAPQAGVDLEPDISGERLVDIVFSKCRFEGNRMNNTVVSPGNLDNSSMPLSYSFNNCYMGNAQVSSEIALVDREISSNQVQGTGSFNNCFVESSAGSINSASVLLDKCGVGYKAYFNNCVLQNAVAPLVFINPSGAGGNGYGAVAFNNCLINYLNNANFVQTQSANPTNPDSLRNVQFQNVTVINPNSGVTYSVVTPSANCVFNFNKLLSIPNTTNLNYNLGSNLIECSGTNSIFKINNGSGNANTYPMAVAYQIAGTGIQGIDFSRMNGFQILPVGAINQADTLFVLKDNIPEPLKQDYVSLNASNFYSNNSTIQTVNINDCIAKLATVGEVGRLDEVRKIQRGLWYNQKFNYSYNNPIVICGPFSFYNNNPILPRITNVTSNGFSFNATEPDYLSGNHSNHEICSYFAVEQGRSQMVSGGYMEANAALNVSGSVSDITFSAPFSSPPVVLVQVATNNNSSIVWARAFNINNTGFSVKLQCQKSIAPTTLTGETVHWIAMDTGMVILQNGLVSKMEIRKITNIMNGNWNTIGLYNNYDFHPQILLAATQTLNDDNPCLLRWNNATSNNIQFLIQNENSLGQLIHGTENIGALFINYINSQNLFGVGQ